MIELCDLERAGIHSDLHRSTIMSAIQRLPGVPELGEVWLVSGWN